MVSRFLYHEDPSIISFYCADGSGAFTPENFRCVKLKLEIFYSLNGIAIIQIATVFLADSYELANFPDFFADILTFITMGGKIEK